MPPWARSPGPSSPSRWCCAPCSFRWPSSRGLTGQFYRQFGITIAASTIISTFNSLTLSPALAALLLKPRNAPPDMFQRGINQIFGRFFGLFNRGFERASERYGHGVRRLTAIRAVVLGVFAFLLAGTWGLFQLVPGGFIPAQDKQYLIGIVQLPDAASLDRTEKVVRRISSSGQGDSRASITSSDFPACRCRASSI